jgi:hypothetical protein
MARPHLEHLSRSLQRLKKGTDEKLFPRPPGKRSHLSHLSLLACPRMLQMDYAPGILN